MESIGNVYVDFINLLCLRKAPIFVKKFQITFRELIGKKTYDEDWSLLKIGDLIKHFELSSNFFLVLGRIVWTHQAANQGNQWVSILFIWFYSLWIVNWDVAKFFYFTFELKATCPWNELKNDFSVYFWVVKNFSIYILSI